MEFSQKEINDKIKKIDGAMSQEGMPLTDENKTIIYNCIIGKSSTEIERKSIIEKYSSIYGSKCAYVMTDDYCYNDTDVLINLLNITNKKDLFNAERDLVSLRTYELCENPIKCNFNFDYLKSIHKFLFQDLYEWAGNIRNCNIAKQNLFCLSEHIDSYAKDIFDKLKKENYYMDYDYNTKIDKMVQLFADINALHPFREGNGRSQRKFIEDLAMEIGINLDLTIVSEKEMIIASHDSINGNYEKLKTIFNNCSSLLIK